MDIIMFAIIGSAIGANALYWICFTVYTAGRVIEAIIDGINERM